MMGWGGLQLWARSSAAKHKFVLGVRLAARWRHSEPTARTHSEPTAQQQGGVAVHLAIGPAYTIWGANTGVGKTLGSMGLARAARALQLPLLYIKPVQTGFPQDSDARAVALACGVQPSVGPHAAQLLTAASPEQNPTASKASAVKVLYAWSRACGPHEAMASEGRAVTDEEILSSVLKEMSSFSVQVAAEAKSSKPLPCTEALTLVETAGGVASPAPSGDLQCDMLRPLRLPCVLIGDPRLGGISATISAYDSLTMRGYDVDAILMLEPPAKPGTPSFNNAAAIRRHLDKAVHRLGMRTEVLSLPGCAAPTPEELVEARGGLDAPVKAWLQDTQTHFEGIIKLLLQRHSARLQRLESMAQQASKQIWWPFTQHASLTPGAVQVIDSRCGEHWQVLEQRPQEAGAGQEASSSQLTSVYDACSSWWTQAVPAQWQPEVAQAVAYAAGRYLHVMFPENAHEPAVQLAGRLLDTVGRGWAQRVFYSDDGSTAIEVALKMAFRKYMHDHGLTPEPGAGPQSVPELQVLALQNSYHGDTLGAMDCVAPSVYNSPLQAAWYRGRGLFLDPPYVALTKGKWTVTQAPAWLQQLAPDAAAVGWSSLEEVMSGARDNTDLTLAYRRHIEAEMQRHEAAGRGRLAAAILEPLLQGAGGMLMVDPQFQRAMVQVCREHDIPVIFDEVMTGFYRLGSLSAAQLLRCQPDLACYAKILTAGVVPMAATLTSEAVFDAYKGPSKLQALLHGHSYTAYPVGCAAALASLDIICNPQTNRNVCAPALTSPGPVESTSNSARATCCKAAGSTDGAQCEAPCGRLLSLWDEQEVDRLSHHTAVSRVVAIGTVLAVEVSSGSARGYAAGGTAVQVARQLRSRHGIFCRPLGPVVYLMVPPTADRSRCQVLLSALVQELDALATDGSGGGEEGVVV